LSNQNTQFKTGGCSQLDNIKKFPVHHIDYDKNNNTEENLITLCWSCHSKTIFSRQKWTDYFETMMKEKLSFIGQKGGDL